MEDLFWLEIGYEQKIIILRNRMNILVITLGSFFTLIAAAILAYISMATPLGPWLAPTIVIISGLIFRLLRVKKSLSDEYKDLALIQTMGSVGGIVAMGVGFTLPMLFFLDEVRFTLWLENPFYFSVILASICISAGGLGIWLARSYARSLIKEEGLAFPVSSLIYKTIVSQSHPSQARQLSAGFSLSVLITILRDGFLSFQGFFSRGVHLFPSLFGRELVFQIWPMVWSVGFIAGLGIVFPLVLGFAARYLILYPLNHVVFKCLHELTSQRVFLPLSDSSFSMAFCSGIIVSGLVVSWLRYPAKLLKRVQQSFSFSQLTYKKLAVHAYGAWNQICSWFISSPSDGEEHDVHGTYRFFSIIEPFFVLSASVIFLSYFHFRLITQAAMLLLTGIFSYQISYFSGSVGLVPFGRFTTFVMLPLFVFFPLDSVQLTLLCVFTNVCFATATDLLFDYKVGQKVGLDYATIHKYQWLGLIVTALGIGFIFWLLCTSFGVGTVELFAHRAKVRSLLIQTLSFDIGPLLLGFLFGMILKKFRLNPMMVFGGILMPPVLTLALSLGALASWFDTKAKDHFSFCSGLFAGEATWITCGLVGKLLWG